MSRVYKRSALLPYYIESATLILSIEALSDVVL
jgi:hypothetical protein